MLYSHMSTVYSTITNIFIFGFLLIFFPCQKGNLFILTITTNEDEKKQIIYTYTQNTSNC